VQRRKGDESNSQNFDSILAAAQHGAPWASTLLWVQFSPGVAAFLAARGSSEPEDLTSEVFLAVLTALPEFRGGEEAFRSYVFSIAYRRLVDELRKRSRRGVHEEWLSETDPRTSPSAESRAVERIGDSNALALLDRLPEPQRDVMVLRVVADLTIEQVAVVLGKKADAVKALQRRALESLRKKIDQDRTLLPTSDDSEK
jgi:RNA polymerase sigma-70 factor (ECF subfamily)